MIVHNTCFFYDSSTQYSQNVLPWPCKLHFLTSLQCFQMFSVIFLVDLKFVLGNNKKITCRLLLEIRELFAIWKQSL